MVPAQSLLPDGQSVVQQAGRLLVFVLIPETDPNKPESDGHAAHTDGRIDPMSSGSEQLAGGAPGLQTARDSDSRRRLFTARDSWG